MISSLQVYIFHENNRDGPFLLFHINSIGLRSGEYGEYHDNRFVIIINRPYRPQKFIEALYIFVFSGKLIYNSLSHNWIKTHCISFHSRGVFFYMWFSIIETPNPHTVLAVLWGELSFMNPIAISFLL